MLSDNKKEEDEREAMGTEDALSTALRKTRLHHMHLLDGGELFFWNAFGAEPDAPMRGPAKKKGGTKGGAKVHGVVALNQGDEGKGVHESAEACANHACMAHHAICDMNDGSMSKTKPSTGHCLPVSMCVAYFRRAPRASRL